MIIMMMRFFEVLRITEKELSVCIQADKNYLSKAVLEFQCIVKIPYFLSILVLLFLRLLAKLHYYYRDKYISGLPTQSYQNDRHHQSGVRREKYVFYG